MKSAPYEEKIKTRLLFPSVPFFTIYRGRPIVEFKPRLYVVRLAQRRACFLGSVVKEEKEAPRTCLEKKRVSFVIITSK